MISDSEGSHNRLPEKPKLRPLEAIPVGEGGREAVCLNDPSRIAPHQLFITPAAITLLPLLNGENDLRDVQSSIYKTYGQLVPLEAIEGLVKALDENMFLEGETFDRFLSGEMSNFAGLPSRPAYMAGKSYPDDPGALAAELKSYRRPPRGPDVAENVRPEKLPKALVAPHIDYARGGPCYAWAYQELPPDQPPGLVVILGVAHSKTDGLFTVMAKDLETPFGTARCERDLAERLIRSLDQSEADGFVHKGEHSVELQAVWLMSLYAQAQGLRVLPILCGSLIPMAAAGKTPEESPDYETPLAALREVLDSWDEANGPIFLLSSADLSHVGPQFGDRETVTEEVQSRVRAYDLALLDRVMEGDYRSFYDIVVRNQDRTNICGLSSIYTLLRLIEAPKGRLLNYDQWTDERGYGLVSFAGLCFS